MSGSIPTPANNWLNWQNRAKETVWHGTYTPTNGYLNSVMYYLVGQATSPGAWMFSYATMTAVLNFQTYWGLTVDGWVGPQTWAYVDWVTTL